MVSVRIFLVVGSIKKCVSESNTPCLCSIFLSLSLHQKKDDFHRPLSHLANKKSTLQVQSALYLFDFIFAFQFKKPSVVFHFGFMLLFPVFTVFGKLLFFHVFFHRSVILGSFLLQPFKQFFSFGFIRFHGNQNLPILLPIFALFLLAQILTRNQIQMQ